MRVSQTAMIGVHRWEFLRDGACQLKIGLLGSWFEQPKVDVGALSQVWIKWDDVNRTTPCHKEFMGFVHLQGGCAWPNCTQHHVSFVR